MRTLKDRLAKELPRAETKNEFRIRLSIVLERIALWLEPSLVQQELMEECPVVMEPIR
jgi:hypothetical protein